MEPRNAEPRQAGSTAEGPILILAGAGTGKTRVIAHRIAHLLQRDSALTPANFLALTFSRKAAREMLERVERLTGTYADTLGVFTFHGFCNRFLQDYALELGLPQRFQLLDSTETWVFFRKLLPQIRLKHYLNLSNPTECIDGFLKFISRAKDELVSPEDFHRYAEGLEESEERKRALEMASVYSVYQQQMREHQCLDFGDLIMESCRHLEARPGLLAQIRAQYRHILVDEFQDTNVAQIALLKLLAGDGRQLCVVGDDDQAIYRFRGASFASFLLMQEAFPNVKTLRLRHNYRSTQKILSVSERLIQNNGTDRYDPDKRLTAEGPAGAPVSVEQVSSNVHEAGRAIEVIQSAACTSGGEPQWNQVAVLYRAHAHRDTLVEALRAHHIPFLVRGRYALLNDPAVKDVIALLKVLQDPDDSVSLFRLLSHPVWDLPGEDLLAISRTCKEQEITLLRALRQAKHLSLKAASQKRVAQLLAELDRLKRQLPQRDVIRLMDALTEGSSLRAVFRMPVTAEGDPVAILAGLKRLAHRYTQSHPEEQSPAEFLWYLDSALKAGMSDSADEESWEVGNRVQLMTIHQAKGLEFDCVILLGMVQGRFPARSRPEQIPFPVALMKESLPKGDFHLQEERRLCYVACTRAKRHLYCFTQEQAYRRPSLFVREMLASGLGNEIQRVAKDKESDAPSDQETYPRGREGARPTALAAERRTLELLEEIRTLDQKDSKGLKRALDEIAQLAAALHAETARKAATLKRSDFPMQEKFSFTQMETFRYCPKKYLYAYIYKIPVRSTPDMQLGSDLHLCLEKFYLEVMAGKAPAEGALLASFKQLHHPCRYGEPFQDREISKLGAQLLRAFYKKQKGAFRPPLFVEKAFTLRLGAVWVRGVVDRVDPLEDGSVEIIDYKSGKPKAKASSEDQLQLRLYALAARDALGLTPKRVSFYYLRNNEKLSFEQEPEALEETRRRITELAEGVAVSDFAATPSVIKCRRCDFRDLCPESLA